MAEKHDDERCANCGACKHCGAPRIQYVPMPYPVYPSYSPPSWTRPYGTYYPNYPIWSNVAQTTSGGTISASSGRPNPYSQMANAT